MTKNVPQFEAHFLSKRVKYQKKHFSAEVPTVISNIYKEKSLGAMDLRHGLKNIRKKREKLVADFGFSCSYR